MMPAALKAKNTSLKQKYLSVYHCKTKFTPDIVLIVLANTNEQMKSCTFEFGKVVRQQNKESAGQNRQSRRKPQKTHRVVTDVSGTSNQAAFAADVDFGAASNVTESQLTAVVTPSQQDVTRNKPLSEHFKLPEGTIVVQPEDATDSPFQGPEFFPPGSCDSDVAEVDARSLDQHCTVCRSKLDISKPDSVYQHALLKVLLCKRCYKAQQSHTSDNSSTTRNYCSWCSAGVSLIYCDVCPAKFCKACVRRNLGRDFLDSIINSDDDEKWHCFVCNPEPLASLVQDCSEFIGRHQKSLRGAGSVKRRKSASNVLHISPPKKSKPAAVITIEPPPPKQDHRKVAPTRGRPAVSHKPKVSSQQVIVSPKSVVSGGLVTIKRPEYTADMIPVNEYNVWPVLEKVLAATQSMSMLLGSLKDDLQRSSALAAARIDSMASSDNLACDIALKRREASLKLWRAFDAYQKSFVDIEAYTRETSKMAKDSEHSNASTSCTSSAAGNDKDQAAVTDKTPVDK